MFVIEKKALAFLSVACLVLYTPNAQLSHIPTNIVEKDIFSRFGLPGAFEAG